MRRWIAIAGILICGGMLYVVVSNVLGEHEQKRSDAKSQEALRSYQEILKPGMTREKVEGYLQSKGVKFERTCCVSNNHLAADITKIWNARTPWYCSDNSMYVAFQFTTPVTEPDPKDVLDKVMLYRHLGGCL